MNDTTRQLGRAAWLGAACFALATACTDADLVAPPRVPIVADSTLGNVVTAARVDAGTIVPALDDALDRLIPAVGETQSAGLRAAFAALRSVAAERSPDVNARLATALATARAAVDQLPADAGAAADRDVLRLVLDAVPGGFTPR